MSSNGLHEREKLLSRETLDNRREEKEHACTTLEWIRRRDPEFDEQLRRFLFGDGPLTGGSAHGAGKTKPGDGTLGLGSLRVREGAS